VHHTHTHPGGYPGSMRTCALDNRIELTQTVGAAAHDDACTEGMRAMPPGEWPGYRASPMLTACLVHFHPYVCSLTHLKGPHSRHLMRGLLIPLWPVGGRDHTKAALPSQVLEPKLLDLQRRGREGGAPTQVEDLALVTQ
jgi:hypothetical protein